MLSTLRLSLSTGAVFLVGAGFAVAAPTVGSVSGTLSSGQTVTVSGSGFGGKSQATPLVWDDFESGTSGAFVGQSAAAVGRWDSGGGSDAVKYTNAKAYAGGKAVLHDFTTVYNSSLAKNGSFPRLYIDFRINVDYVDRVSRNFKPWRLYGDSDSMYVAYTWLCDGGLVAGSSATGWGGDIYADNKWMHMQLIFSESSPGASDGTIRHFVDSQVYGMNSGAVMTRTNSAHLDQIRIGHYWGSGVVDNCQENSGAKVYVDDVYIDTTWARVELGNASTYAASMRREIQIPRTWSDGSISISVNGGTFASGANVYLFVTDANNNTSAGFPVTLGSAAAAPMPPTNVSAE